MYLRKWRAVRWWRPSRSLKSSMEDSSPPVLDARNLFAAGIKDVSFKIRKGEVLGLAALEGHGQSRLFKALVGLNPLRQGGIRSRWETRFYQIAPRGTQRRDRSRARRKEERRDIPRSEHCR